MVQIENQNEKIAYQSEQIAESKLEYESLRTSHARQEALLAENKKQMDKT